MPNLITSPERFDAMVKKTQRELKRGDQEAGNKTYEELGRVKKMAIPDEQEERRMITWNQFRKGGRTIESWENLELASHHTDAEYDELKAKLKKMEEVPEPLTASWAMILNEVDELKAKLDEQECLCAEKHLKDRDTIQELKAQLEQKRVCDRCEKLWDGDACEWNCPQCVLTYLQRENQELKAKLEQREIELAESARWHFHIEGEARNLRAELAQLKKDREKK